MTWRPTARIVRPGSCAAAQLRGLALQPLLAWPGSNLNGGADYSVDFSRLLGCGEAVESFDFDPGTAGPISWVSSYGSCVTAHITWTQAGALTVNVGVLSNMGNTYQVAVSINVSATPALVPGKPQPGPDLTGLTINGGVYMGQSSDLPAGLSSNGGVIMTDGGFYPHTRNNGGVLMTTAGAQP